MEITVKMTVEEFQQFVAWQKEQDYYEKELDKELNKREILENVLGNRRRSEEARQGQNH